MCHSERRYFMLQYRILSSCFTSHYSYPFLPDITSNPIFRLIVDLHIIIFYNTNFQTQNSKLKYDYTKMPGLVIYNSQHSSQSQNAWKRSQCLHWNFSILRTCTQHITSMDHTSTPVGAVTRSVGLSLGHYDCSSNSLKLLQSIYLLRHL